MNLNTQNKILLTIAPILFLLSHNGYGQAVKKIAVKKPTPTNYTPRPNPFSPTPTPIPKLKKPWRHKNGGLSSATASEKYERKVLVEIPKETLFQFMKADGHGSMAALNAELQQAATQQYMYDNHGFLGLTYQVDANENFYLRFEKAIRVFDRNGNLIRTIAKTPQEDRMLVDEDGNLCIYSRSLSPSTARLYNPEGRLVEQPDFKNTKWFELELAKFSHGVLYSTRGTGVLHKLPGVEGRKINFVVVVATPGKTKAVQYPLVIDGYGREQIITTDDAGNSYWKYFEGDDSWPVEEIAHTYKFDPDGNLLAGFDFLPKFINEKTQALYHWEFSPTGISLMKWEKEKR